MDNRNLRQMQEGRYKPLLLPQKDVDWRENTEYNINGFMLKTKNELENNFFQNILIITCKNELYSPLNSRLPGRYSRNGRKPDEGIDTDTDDWTGFHQAG